MAKDIGISLKKPTTPTRKTVFKDPAVQKEYVRLSTDPNLSGKQLQAAMSAFRRGIKSLGPLSIAPIVTGAIREAKKQQIRKNIGVGYKGRGA